ncbi:Gene 58 protein [Varanus komodoensis]|nr:Gene 58 protein [Varanus komodoensis]
MSLDHQGHQVPLDLLGQEENLGLEAGQDSQVHLVCKGHLETEGYLERKVKEGLDHQDHEVCLGHQVHKGNPELAHQVLQAHGVHLGHPAVRVMRASEVLLGPLDTVIHPSALALLTTVKDIQTHFQVNELRINAIKIFTHYHITNAKRNTTLSHTPRLLGSTTDPFQPLAQFVELPPKEPEQYVGSSSTWHCSTQVNIHHFHATFRVNCLQELGVLSCREGKPSFLPLLPLRLMEGPVWSSSWLDVIFEKKAVQPPMAPGLLTDDRRSPVPGESVVHEAPTETVTHEKTLHLTPSAQESTPQPNIETAEPAAASSSDPEQTPGPLSETESHVKEEAASSTQKEAEQTASSPSDADLPEPETEDTIGVMDFSKAENRRKVVNYHPKQGKHQRMAGLETLRATLQLQSID